MSGGFNPNIHAPPGSVMMTTLWGTQIVTPDGRVMSTNPNEAAMANPWGSRTAMFWDPASGSMVPLSSMGGGVGGGGGGAMGGGMGGLGPSSIIQSPGMGSGGMGGISGQYGTVTINGVTYPGTGGGFSNGGGGMGGQFGTVSINGTTYPGTGGGYSGDHRGGHGGHYPGHGRGVQGTYPGGGWGSGWGGGHGNHGGHQGGRGGHGGHHGGWDTVGPVPPGSRPVDPYRDFNPPYGGGRGGHHPHPGPALPPTINAPSGWPTVPKKLRDAPEKVRKEDLPADGKDCSICYKPFFEEEDGEVEIPVKLRSCGHIFGEQCIHEWVQTNNSCPTCRKEFVAVRAWMLGSG